MTRRKFGFFIISQLALLLSFVTINIGKVEAKELTNIISDIRVWQTNYKEVTPDANGVYPLSTRDNYSLQIGFDLAGSTEDVQDNDYFNFSIPAPLTVANGTIELVDDKSGIAIGDGVVTSNGEGQGGNVSISLKNLSTYLAQTGAQEVENIKGTFYVSFKVSATQTAVPVVFTNIKNVGNLSINIKVNEWTGWPDNSTGLSGENVSKYAGVLSNRPYTSATLGKSGDWVHPWALRINASRKTYDSLTITDTIDIASVGVQFIPESLILQATDVGFDNSYTIQNPTTLTEGVDYTITYSDDYKKFVITILNPGNKAFHLGYSTTAPADGSIVGNVLQVASPEGNIPIGDHTTETSVTVSRLSQVTQGGTIQLEVGSRITLEKIDTATGKPIAGAVFKVTKPDGTELLLAPTNANGITQSPRFTETELNSGNFIVTEVISPVGYQLNSTPLSLTVTTAGVVQQVGNTKKQAAVATITANKVLTGRDLKEGEFTFTLTSEDGSQIYRSSNKANGAIDFENLTFDTIGTYTYTLQEEEGTDLTIAYDTTPKTVVIEVLDNGSNQLVARVTSGDVTVTNTVKDDVVNPPGGSDGGTTSGGGTTTGSGTDGTATTSGSGGSGNTTNATATNARVSAASTSLTSGKGSTSSKVLPKTGETASYISMIGLGIIGLLGLAFAINKKASAHKR